MKKQTLYQTLPQGEKENTEIFINQYYRSSLTLAQIFNVNPKSYNYVSLHELGLSARVISALTKPRGGHHVVYRNQHFKTENLHDLLNCTVSQFMYIRQIGKLGINEILTLTRKYIEEHEEDRTEETAIRQIQKLLDVICLSDKTISEATSTLQELFAKE